MATSPTRSAGPRDVARAPAVAAGLLGLLLLAGLVLLWPRGPLPPGFGEALAAGHVERAEVLEVRPSDCPQVPGVPSAEGCGTVLVRLRSGPDEGSVAEIPTTGDVPISGPGELVLVTRPNDVAGPDAPYALADRLRLGPLLGLAALFAAAVVALGRLRGLAALTGLAVSLALLTVFVVPAILHGRPPVLVAVVGAGVLAMVVLYLTHGFRPETTTAFLGTLSGLACAAAAAEIWVPLAALTGSTAEEAIALRAAGLEVDLAGLLLAGIVIGALGAIDDVAITQAAAVAELARRDPNATRAELRRAGMRLGRAHVGSIVNTLLLAYAGAALPAFLLLSLSETSLVIAANQELLAAEIVRTLAGSLGLVAAVPVTTRLAARTAAPR